ncbi:metal-dependent transcriptional regulator [Georgenia halophila]|uniref:Metal-dependent transcriptional regulator n=1 Tax=Georgenia halophila TaxID=620889 RepID=A0ABP8KTI5_9MICO
MSDLIDTTEMYLKTVYELEEEGIVALRARIAERLGHSGPTVSQTVARMERDGLLLLTDNRRLQLTDEGRQKAIHVMRKHRLAERLLIDVIGLDWPHVHEEACRWEHVMSEQVERRLVDLLDHPHIDPYGNPIPGLEELGEGHTSAPDRPGLALTDVVAASSPDGLPGRPPAAGATDGRAAAREVVLERIGEPLQVDVELLARMADAGLHPGVRLELRVLPAGDVVALHAPGAEVELEVPDEIARHLFVTT